MRDSVTSRDNPYDEVEFFLKYQAMRTMGAGYNELLEQPALRALLPNVESCEVLDLGCGDGSLARLLLAAGASRVVGVDPSARMLDLASIRTTSNRIEYRQAFGEDLDYPQCSLDLVVSSLALHYVADLAGLLRRVAGWLRPGGYLVASLEHPVITAAPNYQSAGSFIVADYADEGPRHTRWFTHGVTKHHRTLSSIVTSVIDAGLMLERLTEPTPTPVIVAEHPHLAIHRQRPPLLLIRARRDCWLNGVTGLTR
jgi:SAM-dependent methyltransferase